MTGSRSRSSPLNDLDAAARGRVRLAGLVAGLVAVALVLGLGDRLSRPLYDLFQNVSPAPPASHQVRVVVIDADSLRAVGGWPWSRFYMARLVDEISRRGATAIGLDLLMPEPDRLDPPRFADLYGELTPKAAAEVRALPSMDAIFARTIGRNPVVLARAGVQAHSFDAVDQSASRRSRSPRSSPATRRGACETFPRVLTNLPLLDGAALGLGLVNGDPDDDGVVRRVPLVADVAGTPTPGFALELVRDRQGRRPDRPDPGRRPTGGRAGRRPRVPASPRRRTGPALRRLASDPRDIGGEPVPQRAAGRPVQGPDRAGGPDQRRLLGRRPSAPRRRDLRRVRAGRGGGRHPARRGTAAAGLDGLGGMGPGRAARGGGRPGGSRGCRSSRWSGPQLSGLAATLGASWGGFLTGLLLDPFPVLTPAAATTAAMVAALFVEGRALQARLRAALEDERLKAARTEGELAAAAEIQLGMLLPRDELAALSDDVEIDAVLQPARNVGGDLYDAFRLDQGRLCFLVGDVTGKGVPAALFMALAKSLARSLLTRPDHDLTTAVARINAELSQDNRQDMALTLLVGVLRLADGHVDLVCAGHENPLVARADGEVRELALRGGPPLCVDPWFAYSR